MKPYHKNPRQINKKQYDNLTDTLKRLGDLSGIVHDLNSDEIIGGNMRSNVFDIAKCRIEIVEECDPPDEQGTVAHGFVLWQDKRYSYRQVRWTERQCEEANVVANKAGGEWDFDVLANQFDMGDLLTWGFEDASGIVNAAEIASFGEDMEGNGGSERKLGDKKRQIKPVIYMDEVGAFEEAILKTGERNRGQAVLEICKFYLKHVEQTER